MSEIVECVQVGIKQVTIKRLYNGFLEFREDEVKKATDKNMGLKLIVKAQRKDHQIISLQELLNHNPAMIIPMKAKGKYKEDYKLYRWIWNPEQRKGHVIKRIHKDDGNKRSN